MADLPRASRPAIVGTGWAVPSQVRTNDDPIFDWLKEHAPPGSDLFQGYCERRVLSDGEGLSTILVPACRAAIEASGVAPGEIDLLLGTASVSKYATPDAIAYLPKELGLSPACWTLPLGDDFSNFNAGVVLADAMIRAGRARHALVTCAGNWTRYVDYHTPQAVSAADGAGAAVIARTTERAWEVVDVLTSTDASWYGTMFMRGDEVKVPHCKSLWTHATFHITDRGQEGFKTFGTEEPPKVANALLEKHGLRGSDVSLISHQASSVLIDAWRDAIGPAQYCQTLEQFANVTVANIPLNLGYFADRIEKDHLVLLAVGIDMHANAVLLRRR